MRWEQAGFRLRKASRMAGGSVRVAEEEKPQKDQHTCTLATTLDAAAEAPEAHPVSALSDQQNSAFATAGSCSPSLRFFFCVLPDNPAGLPHLHDSGNTGPLHFCRAEASGRCAHPRLHPYPLARLPERVRRRKNDGSHTEPAWRPCSDAA